MIAESKFILPDRTVIVRAADINHATGTVTLTVEEQMFDGFKLQLLPDEDKYVRIIIIEEEDNGS